MSDVQTFSQINWQVFRRDTEASRILGRLYGEERKEVINKIHYPKLKLNDSSEELKSRSRFTTYCSKSLDNRDIIERRKKASSVIVPKLGRSKTMKISKLSSLPRLKPFVQCQKQIQENKEYNHAYRPPNIKNLCDEKNRLVEAFERNVGKSLPVMPDVIIPTDSKGRYNDNKRIEELSWTEQIVSEIKERRDFQRKMEENGCGDESRERVCREITDRLRELMVHEKEVALTLMKEEQ